jgi:hypothetical protein
MFNILHGGEVAVSTPPDVSRNTVTNKPIILRRRTC